jgi:serine/threonine protein phosphatase PrpC
LFQLNSWGLTDVGRRRPRNQDAFLIDPRLSLFVVCDGMGGAAAGDVASKMAVEGMAKVVLAESERLVAITHPASREERLWILDLMESAVHEAARVVYNEAVLNPEMQGMGTTLTAVCAAGGRGFLVHVGDSRSYLLRRGQVHLLTEDHTVVRELVKSGRVSPEKARKLPFQGALSRAVGVQESVKADRMEFQFCDGDRLLLCSDGLHSYLTTKDLLGVLGSPNVADAPQAFIDLANKGGGRDNITAVVVDVGIGIDPSVDTAPEQFQVRVDTLREIPLFKQLTDRELIELMSNMDEHTHAAGKVVMAEGQSGDSFHVIIQGKAAVTKGETVLAEVGRGGLLGEMALLDDLPRSATVRATERLHSLSISRTRFQGLLRSNPALSNKILWCFLHMLNRRLRTTTDDLVESGSRVGKVPDIF